MPTASMVSRFTRRVHTLPVKAKTFYLVLLLFGFFISVFSRWMAGVLPSAPITIDDVYDILSDPILIVGILAAYYYLDDEIADAMDQSREISALSDEQYSKLKNELVVIPLWPHLAVGLIFGAGAVQGAFETYGLNTIRPSNILLLAEWALVGALFFGFAYRVIRLIFLSGRFYAGPLHLDLYNLPPVYELSSAVGKVALVQLLFWYPNLYFNTNAVSSPYRLVIVLIVSLAPLMAFLVPQAILSRRLAREKSDRVVRVQKELESTFVRLSSEIKKENIDGSRSIQSAIDSLVSERRFIESIPTWPWRLGTFRVAVTAVLLPVFVWLIQQVLDRLLNF